ncbi:MAG TPA: hypothetical protein VIC26_11195 [Marinagarivorans sp.]
MRFQLAAMPFVLSVLVGCEGGACPAVAIPVYEVSVYDAVSGELICYDGLDARPDLRDCEITYVYTENGQAADITVSLSGYTTEVLGAIDNETGRLGCWDNPDYITPVEVYLYVE